jgi:hypothetical protein
MLRVPSRKASASLGRHARRRSGRRGLARMRSKWLALVAVLGLVAAGVMITATTSSSSSATATNAQPEANWTGSVTVNTSGAAEGTLDDHYVGLAVGTDLLNSGKLDNVGNLSVLLKNLGTSVIRFGGIVADQYFNGITPQSLAGLARLTKASGWSVLYTESIGQFPTAKVAADAGAVSRALGSSLAAFACGNEPEYLSDDGVKPKGYSVGDYLSDAANCIEAIDAGAPNAPIEGPETVTEPTWPAAYAANEAGMIKAFGIHFYALPCGLNGETPAERATQLFSQSGIARDVWWFDWAKTDAETAKASLWMTEVNTACGGGDPGLSNTFASALWIIDYLLLGAEHGVSEMNVQGGLGTCEGYSPLCAVSTNEYKAQPIYYGMLFAHMLGTGKLLPVTVSDGSSAGGLAAHALESSTGGVKVILENFSQHQAVIKLSAPGIFSSASVLHLTAPSLLTTSGINIQGAQVNANGTIKPGKPSIVQCSAGACPISVAPYSAALISLFK